MRTLLSDWSAKASTQRPPAYFPRTKTKRTQCTGPLSYESRTMIAWQWSKRRELGDMRTQDEALYRPTSSSKISVWPHKMTLRLCWTLPLASDRHQIHLRDEMSIQLGLARVRSTYGDDSRHTSERDRLLGIHLNRPSKRRAAASSEKRSFQ